MSDEVFEFEYNALEEMLIVNYQEGFSYNMADEGDVYSVVTKLNEQQSLIGRLQEESLYKNFELKSVDDLKKLKNIFEICMILIDGAIEDKDLELGYESVFQFEMRIKKFNGD